MKRQRYILSFNRYLENLLLKRDFYRFAILVFLLLMTSILMSGCGAMSIVNGIVIDVMDRRIDSSPVSGPEDALELALHFIQTNNSQVVISPASEWQAGEVLSDELLGGTIYHYSAGDWSGKVIYPLVPPNTAPYRIRIEQRKSGYFWEGFVEPSGQTVMTSLSFDTRTATPTGTLAPDLAKITPTPVPPSVTPEGHCDWLTFVKDVTIPDGTTLKPEQTFVKTWRLKNRGMCTWTTTYELVFTSGNQMGSTTVVNLPGSVTPGETVDVSVALTAPSSIGKYRGYWMLRNASGKIFGYGEDADQAFYVDIQAVSRDSGLVSGKICFPSEHIPQMTLYFPNMEKNKLIEIPITENQTSYRVHLEPGEYLAYAWTLNLEAAGGYTHADHRLKSFNVRPGESLDNVDICDWYGDPGSIPLPSEEKFGTITGKLSFPSEQIPALRVVAFDIYNNAYHWVDTMPNQQTYEIRKLMPGYYTIVAYERNTGFAGGYSEHSKCGLAQDCPEDHTLVVIYVTPGITNQNINPSDWYAPAGAYPEDPTQ